MRVGLKAVLTNKMAILLADTARKLTKLFANTKLDIEWVYAGDELFIVQTRPLVGRRYSAASVTEWAECSEACSAASSGPPFHRARLISARPLL